MSPTLYSVKDTLTVMDTASKSFPKGCMENWMRTTQNHRNQIPTEEKPQNQICFIQNIWKWFARWHVEYLDVM